MQLKTSSRASQMWGSPNPRPQDLLASPSGAAVRARVRVWVGWGWDGEQTNMPHIHSKAGHLCRAFFFCMLATKAADAFFLRNYGGLVWSWAVELRETNPTKEDQTEPHKSVARPQRRTTE